MQAAGIGSASEAEIERRGALPRATGFDHSMIQVSRGCACGFSGVLQELQKNLERMKWLMARYFKRASTLLDISRIRAMGRNSHASILRALTPQGEREF